MKNMKERWKRAAAIGLAAILLTAQLPVAAFAEEAVMQETAAELVTTQEMTAAAETPEQTENETAPEAPEQTENETAAEGETAPEVPEQPEGTAAPEQPEIGTGDEAPVEAAVPVEQSIPAEAAKDGSGDEAEKQEATEPVKAPAFKESRSVDGVKITVEAEEGVFPEGATLSVEKVTLAQEKQAEEAVEEKRPDEQNVAASYTYDIKVLDKDGNEIQPADESKVKVSFTLEEVADANLTTNVYHIVEEDSQNGGDSAEAAPKEGDNPENSRNEEADAGNNAELTAEKLEVETDGDTAIVETDGFSLYTVEFTYENKQYVLPGDSEVALSDILEAVGLSGEASAVEVSNSSLFSAEKNEGGEWIVTAHKAFHTKEWMKVLIGGVEYEITVTDDQEAGSWAELQAQFESASTDENNPTLITLSGNVTAGEDDSALEIPTDRYVTLDLNGHTIDRGLADKAANDNGSVIRVEGNLTLIDTSEDQTGKITGGNIGQEGGGVYVDSHGEFTMEGGTISDCSANYKGGGVLVQGGTFTMNGGTITNCNAESGGGVNVANGRFTMEGGTISGCSAGSGGGVCVTGSPVEKGMFIMERGTITGCKAVVGGGVYVYFSGTFNMDGGTISACNAIPPASLSSGVTYLIFGGGVFVDKNGTFNMDGGTISACTASSPENPPSGVTYKISGGGVCVLGSGTFKVSGAPVIRDNKKDVSANNVELINGKTITVSGALIPGAEIWVNADKGVAFAENGDSYSITDTDLAKFHSDKDSSLVAAEDSDGSVKFFTPWGALQAKFNNASTVAGSPTQIKLTGNVTAGEGDTTLVIPAGKYVTLDLSGHTIDRGLAGQGVGNNGNVITVSGNLTLTDSSSAHTGTITGGNNEQDNGGGVSVKGGTFTMDGGTISGCNAALGGGVNVDRGTFTMTGGTITGCNAYNSGGGVCVNGSFTMKGGTFTMTGGTITDCNATSQGGRGGGVYVDSGTFTMENGTITGCKANNSGGGVYNHGTFNMSGGTITNCSATGDESNGGGVYIESRGTFKVSGTPVISGNMKGSTSANNVELGGKTISVNGALTSGAEIHVNAGLGVPIAEKGGDRTTALTETEAGYFKSDVDSNLLGGLNADGQVVLKDPLPALTGASNLIYNGTEQTPALTFSGDPAPELTAGTDYTVSYKKVTEGTETAISGSPKDAGDYKAVVTGKGRYAGTSEAEFTIARKEVTVSSGIVAKDKSYDGTADATLYSTEATVFDGICDGDSLTVSGTGTFDSETAGSNKTVTIDKSSLTLGGTSSGNYVLAGSGNQTTATANITKATPTIITNPEAAAITYGNTLSDSNLTNGAAKLGETDVPGTFAWSDPTTAPAVSDSNKTEYTVTFTPNDSSNLNTTTCKVKLTVNKADITEDQITAPAKIENLEYTGQALSLISAGSVSGNIGTMQYVLGTDVECPVDFTPAIPSATNAGIYHVWYKVKGDDNHNDTAVSGPVAVVIAKADYTNNTVSGNTKYGLAGKVDLKDCIAPGGTLGTMTVSDPDAVLEGSPSLSGTVLSYKFKSLSENVGKAARVTVSVNNAPNYKDYEVTATLNVIDCDHAHTELQGVKTGNCTEEGYSGDLVCTECGSIIEYGHPTAKVPDAHDFDEGTRTKDPTTITKGETTYRCRRCGYEKVAQDIPCVEEEGKDYDDLREDVEGLSGDKAPRISVSENEAGDSVETVIIGGEEVSKTVTDKDTGKETIVSKVWIGGLQDSYSYAGSAIKPAFHVYDGTTQLAEKTDYTVSYKNNKDAGAATVEIKFKGNYKDTKAQTLSFTISKAELGKDIIAHEVGVAQKKSAQKPVPVLTWGETGKTVSSKYFNVSYSPSTVRAAGEYTATITPKSGSGSKNFSGSTTVRLVVTTKDKVLSNAKVSFDKKSYAYTGSAVTPKYSLKLDGRTLTENRDYRLIDICNNTAPGTATVIFEGTGSYVGTKTATFKISGKIELNDTSDFTYTYDAAVPFVKGGATPAVRVRDNRNNVNLKEGKDYVVSYSKNKSIAGTPTIKIKGKGTYKGNVYRSFTITQQDISKLTITAADQFVKGSKLKKATVTIYDTDGNKLSSGKDFLVGANGTPAGDENTGTVTVGVTGAGNYIGKAAATFRYLDVSANIGKAGTKKIPDQSYTGNAVRLSYADLTNVLYTGSKSTPKYLIPGTDFEIVSYSNNTKRGTAKVVLKGKGSYAGTKTLSFKIVQRKVNYAGKL